MKIELPSVEAKLTTIRASRTPVKKASPTDDMVDGMAKATIYEPDHKLPEFVDIGSKIGSSVSVTAMTIRQVDVVLFDNASHRLSFTLPRLKR